MVRDIGCIKCWKCVESCPQGAIEKVNDTREIDRQKCDLCGECVKACPTGVIELIGKSMSVTEVVEEIEKDRLFYVNSGGGVTFSGGEPLFQAEFVTEVAKVCKQKGIHTALDTTGYVSWSVMREALKYIDLVLYDIKHLDSLMHKKETGSTNKLILDNLRKTVTRATTWLRIPLIPGFNDSESYIRELANFIAGLPNGKIQKVSLLPYHSWGEQKYQRLGKKYSLEETVPPKDDHVQRLGEILKSSGLNISIGS